MAGAGWGRTPTATLKNLWSTLALVMALVLGSVATWAGSR